jgi:hypothetical protein
MEWLLCITTIFIIYFFSTGSFFNSTTLEELILDGSSFPTNYLQNIGAFSALKILSFSGCDLNSTLPAKGKLTTPAHVYINN